MPNAATFVQVKTAHGGGASIAAAFNSNTVAGNMIVVAVGNACDGTAFTPTVSDTQGNTYQLVSGSYFNSSSALLWIAIATAGGANTVTVAGLNTSGQTAGAPSLIIAEYSPSTSYVVFGSGLNPIPGNQNMGLDQGNQNAAGWGGYSNGASGGGKISFVSGNARTNWHMVALQVIQPGSDVTIIAATYDASGFASSDTWSASPGTVRGSVVETNNADGLVLGDNDFTLSGSSGGLAIICNSPPNGQVGVSTYSHAFPASGGTPPYTFAIISGSLPPGLTLNTMTGVVSGTPTTAGTFTFTIQVTDSLSHTASVSCSITITASTPLGISCNNPQGGIVGVAYSHNLTASGGVPPYTFAIISGSLPTGLTMNAAGLISGTPSAAGTYTFTAQVTDSLSTTATVTCTIIIQGGGGGGTDNAFRLERVVAVMKAQRRMPVRGSST